MKNQNDFVIYINGHADIDADSSYNQMLSLKRSNAVKEYLVKSGFADSVIKVQAFGEEQPLLANGIPLEKAKNRRVEIFVLFNEGIEEIEVLNKDYDSACDKDTTIAFQDGYLMTLSQCDWENNKECLSIEKRVLYNFKIKENWIKRRIGFEDYFKIVSCEPYYKFYVTACNENCFIKKMKLHIPKYSVPGLMISSKFYQKKNNEKHTTRLVLKKTKIGTAAYYSTNIYCPGTFNCGTDKRCDHDVELHAKNNISILSYSYSTRGMNSNYDTLVETTSTNSKKLTDNYRHAFFKTLTLLHKGETITLNNVPIDIFSHGLRKIKLDEYYQEKSYFLFIPYTKKYKCGHYKKYKIRARDLKSLKQFNVLDLLKD